MDGSNITHRTDNAAVKIVKLVGVINLVIFALVSAVLFSVDIMQKAKCTEKITAVVIDNVSGSDDSGPTYAPLFSYEYKGGNYRAASNVYTNPPLFEKGETTEIYINPLDPDEIYVPHGNIMYIIEATLLGVGIIVFVILFFVVPAVLQTKEEPVSYNESGESFEKGE